MGRWSEEFTKGPHFERLTESQKEKADSVITFFADYAYSYLGATPEEWDRSVVIECCTEVLPRKVSAEPPFFEAVAPVLSAFFTSLADRGLLDQGHHLAKVAAGLERKITAGAKDPRNWGMAKSLMMAALEEGVEPGDQQAMDAFLARYNERLFDARPAQRQTASPAEPDSLPEPPAPAQRSGPKIGRNDPCPCGSGKKYKKSCGA